MKNEIEVLAPAGSMECMEAAVSAGADAVYLGGSMFGARAYADNFNKEQLLGAIDYGHCFGRKVYLTVNTLVKEEEISRLTDFLLPFYCQGLDGVIVQDFGVLSVIQRNFPDIEIHGSTQMSITSAFGARLLKKAHCTRVVSARELSLEEIKEIKDQTGLAIEDFVHGALCYSYSGRCFMSSMLGGRSGNRGRCAGTCRLPFTLYQNGKKLNTKDRDYPLSMRDLCTLQMLPQLIENGVTSLKIEGRMKHPDYVWAVTSMYRKYVDLYLSGKPYHVDQEDICLLQSLFNRDGFTDGYYQWNRNKEMISSRWPGNFGVKAGTIEKIKNGQLFFTPELPMAAGDILNVRDNGRVLSEMTCPREFQPGKTAELKTGNVRKLKPGMSIYRMRSQNVWEWIQAERRKKTKEKIKGKVRICSGKPVTLEVELKGIHADAAGPVAECAKQHSATKEQVQKQLRKTGDTMYEFDQLTIQMDEGLFLPVSVLKNLRRDALKSLTKARVHQYRRETPSINGWNENRMVHSPKQYKQPVIGAVLEDDRLISCLLKHPDISYLYLPIYELIQKPELISMCRNMGKKVIGVLPDLMRVQEMADCKAFLPFLLNEDISGVLLKNVDQVEWISQLSLDHKELILDDSIYAYNKTAQNFWREKCSRKISFTFPTELSFHEWKQLDLFGGDLCFYGHLPLMISAQCPQNNFSACKPTGNRIIMKDRYKKNFHILTRCRYCETLIYNGIPLWLGEEYQRILPLHPARIRLHFTDEQEGMAEKVIDAAASLMAGGSYKAPVSEYTKCHYQRGIE